MEPGMLRANSGFTLVEVLLAFALTLLILAGACRLAHLSTQAATSADRLTWAVHLCNAKLVELEASQGDQLGWHADAANPLRLNGHVFARYWTVTACPGGQLARVFVILAEPGRNFNVQAGSQADLAGCPSQSLSCFIVSE